MNAYGIALFLHIAAALGAAGAMGLEWVAVARLRVAVRGSQVHEWLQVVEGARGMLIRTAGLLLASGIYMSWVTWRMQPWIVAGFMGLLLMAMIGAKVTTRRFRALAKTISGDESPLALEQRRSLADPMLLVSLRLRTAIGLAVVFLMSTKPSTLACVLILSASLAAPLAAGAARRARPVPANASLA